MIAETVIGIMEFLVMSLFKVRSGLYIKKGVKMKINKGLEEIREYERTLAVISSVIYLGCIICVLALVFRAYF